MHLTYQTYHLWLLVSTCHMYLPPISGYFWWNWGWFVDQINSSSSSTPSESWHQPHRDDLQTEPRRWDCPRGSDCSRTCLVCHEWPNDTKCYDVTMTWQWRYDVNCHGLVSLLVSWLLVPGRCPIREAPWNILKEQAPRRPVSSCNLGHEVWFFPQLSF